MYTCALLRTRAFTSKVFNYKVNDNIKSLSWCICMRTCAFDEWQRPRNRRGRGVSAKSRHIIEPTNTHTHRHFLPPKYVQQQHTKDRRIVIVYNSGVSFSLSSRSFAPFAMEIMPYTHILFHKQVHITSSPPQEIRSTMNLCGHPWMLSSSSQTQHRSSYIAYRKINTRTIIIIARHTRVFFLYCKRGTSSSS